MESCVSDGGRIYCTALAFQWHYSYSLKEQGIVIWRYTEHSPVTFSSEVGGRITLLFAPIYIAVVRGSFRIIKKTTKLCLARCEVLTAVFMNPIFWDITLCNPLKINRRFWGTCRLQVTSLCLPFFFSLACSTTLKIEVICYSETSVDFQQTTPRYIPGVEFIMLYFVSQ
jgi:hypothetical protein